MSSRFLPRRTSALALLLAALACHPTASSDAPPPPRAEFLLSAGDSSFWVTSVNGTVQVRGAALDVARVEGRLYELYVTDDDRSFGDAVLVGQRVYRRDLVTDDSMLVYQDTIVPRVARLYARLHPDDAPLAPAEEESDEPLWTATSTLDLDEVTGPFVSYSLHADVDRDDAPLWHTSRRGVLDLRRGGSATLAMVAGNASADVERHRVDVMRSTLDSVRASEDDLGHRAAAALSHYRLDPASFSLTTLAGAPAVSFALTGEGDGDAGHLLALPPIPIGEPAWWMAAAPTLPVSSSDGLREVWRRNQYEVVVHYDVEGGSGRLVLRDGTSREYSVGRVPAPATRIIWLDEPPIDSATRHGLDRAFNESILYDDAARAVAWRHGPTRRTPVSIIRVRHRPLDPLSRHPSRHVREHHT